MIRSTTLALLLLLPSGWSTAQERRSRPNAPAVGAQLPPSEPPRRDPAGPAPPTGDPRTGSTEMRTAPPPGHQVLGGPPVPGATQPQRSEGFAPRPDPIPARPRTSSDATTTGR